MKLFFKLYLKFKGIPHRWQVEHSLGVRRPINIIKRNVAELYVLGYDFKEIGIFHRIPPERVRQLLIAVVS